jgi:hypothetical protein
MANNVLEIKITPRQLMMLNARSAAWDKHFGLVMWMGFASAGTLVLLVSHHRHLVVRRSCPMSDPVTIFLKKNSTSWHQQLNIHTPIKVCAMLLMITTTVMPRKLL